MASTYQPRQPGTAERELAHLFSATKTWRTLNAGKPTERREATVTVKRVDASVSTRWTTDDFGGKRAARATTFLVVFVPEYTHTHTGQPVEVPAHWYIEGLRSQLAPYSTHKVRGHYAIALPIVEAEA